MQPGRGGGDGGLEIQWHLQRDLRVVALNTNSRMHA